MSGFARTGTVRPRTRDEPEFSSWRHRFVDDMSAECLGPDDLAAVRTCTPRITHLRGHDGACHQFPAG